MVYYLSLHLAVESPQGVCACRARTSARVSGSGHTSRPGGGRPSRSTLRHPYLTPRPYYLPLYAQLTHAVHAKLRPVAPFVDSAVAARLGGQKSGPLQILLFLLAPSPPLLLLRPPSTADCARRAAWHASARAGTEARGPAGGFGVGVEKRAFCPLPLPVPTPNMDRSSLKCRYGAGVC